MWWQDPRLVHQRCAHGPATSMAVTSMAPTSTAASSPLMSTSGASSGLLLLGPLLLWQQAILCVYRWCAHLLVPSMGLILIAPL